MKVTFNVKFNTHGFEVGKDISEEEFEVMKAEFMALYNHFCDKSNGIIDKLNDTWDKYEHIKKMSEIEGIPAIAECMLNVMGLKSGGDYNDWIEKWYREICVEIDAIAAFAGFKLRSNIFRDDDVPVFGVKVFDKPDWTMDMTLEQAPV